jgi:hypothetical protein
MQEYYGLNIDDMGSAYSLEHGIVCAALLPHTARVYQAENEALAWSDSTAMLADCANSLRLITQGLSKHPTKPDLFRPPGTDKPKGHADRIEPMTAAEFEALRTAREVDNAHQPS